MPNSDNFNKSAISLAQSPLGIIALFIVLVYGLASLVVIFGSTLDINEKGIIIIFLVTFPLIVLAIFTYLVVCHYDKLFGPSNFKNEDNFIRMRMNTVALLTAAAGNKNEAISQKEIEGIVQTVVSSTNRPSLSRQNKGDILWVDDRPKNNIYERKAFEGIGQKISLALSTNEALIQLSQRDFGAIISDMGRVEGPREGYVLLDKIRKNGSQTPLFFYASSILLYTRKKQPNTAVKDVQIMDKNFLRWS